MPEPTYTITITETERAAYAKVLGGFVTKLVNAPVQVDAASPSASSGTDAARALLSPPAAAPAPPIAARDRWARDRKGNETPPKEYQTVEAKIWKVERKDLPDNTPRMRVTWPAPTTGYVDANCFDDRLFPWLSAGASNGQVTTLHIVRSGKYTNVVGVRA
jgi:hypothetical protein